MPALIPPRSQPAPNLVAGPSTAVYKSAVESESAQLDPGSERDLVAADDSDGILAITESTYDVDLIMSNLRRRLMRDSLTGNLDLTNQGSSESDELPASLESSTKYGVIPGADDLAWQLFQARAESNENHVADHMRGASGMVGGIVTRVRRPLHQLARFYANLVARKQRRVNDRLIQVVRVLATRSEEDRTTISRLREEVAELRSRIDTPRSADDLASGGRDKSARSE